ncbi:MAG TPA: GntG family PLP-dependent aldolase [Thermoanaerobaculia bacterium]|nr:GntG family PLP-dependent aldolase [Thermoanaerobaculia bacterium]HUM28809.1 GntG family PLP-dependent aldolase [Thermoanaerobaculia bacterium]HXK69066.1 GntG family PLP-dependent aldolase [Thermoanaerobaculia bacterium]
MIDLRSDTVTRPTRAMRLAMMNAEVGDDVYEEDPTIGKLESSVADLLGKEAAIFVPTGSMGNQIAVHIHASSGDEVILEAKSHIYNFEMGAMAALTGAVPRILPGEGGLPDPEAVKKAILPPLTYRSKTALIALENTHNLHGGRILPQKGVSAVLQVARENNLPTHLDGARLWHTAKALNVPESDLAQGFDSVMVCLSKGLCAPIGSVLCGSRTFIAKARRVRKMFGGGMRQVGILGAAGLEALAMRDRLGEDHEKALRAARRLAALPGISLDLDSVETNILVFTLDHPLGPDVFQRKSIEKGVLLSRLGDTFRLVTHHDVSFEEVERAVDILEEILR